jgi:hypothetical protein
MKADVRRKFEDEGEEPTESVPVSNLGEWWFTGYLAEWWFTGYLGEWWFTGYLGEW